MGGYVITGFLVFLGLAFAAAAYNAYRTRNTNPAYPDAKKELEPQTIVPQSAPAAKSGAKRATKKGGSPKKG